MTQVERLRAEPVPAELYHYTTQTGLLGILQSNCMWATAAHYLNDSAEYEFGLHLIRDALQSEGKKSASNVEASRLIAIAQNISPFSSVCVASLSSQGDLLSQWRAYTGDSAGFALSIRSDHLRKAAHSQGFYLVRCLYTSADQQDGIRQLISEFRERLITSAEWGLEEQGACVAAASRLAVMIKDKSFEEEHEWRLISIPKMINELEFRQGKSTLIPFFRFVLGEDRNAYLNSVRVGPTPHRELGAKAGQMLLRKLGLSNPAGMIGETQIPFRNW